MYMLDHVTVLEGPRFQPWMSVPSTCCDDTSTTATFVSSNVSRLRSFSLVCTFCRIFNAACRLLACDPIFVDPSFKDSDVSACFSPVLLFTLPFFPGASFGSSDFHPTLVATAILSSWACFFARCSDFLNLLAAFSLKKVFAPASSGGSSNSPKPSASTTRSSSSSSSSSSITFSPFDSWASAVLSSSSSFFFCPSSHLLLSSRSSASRFRRLPPVMSALRNTALATW
mmetsp:Transcript_16074/g.37652  ORF Transcript_16074/g.37652 Transcript_16074/m.37652 type:complete len:228 (+) Transcript_16074:82-765(+)